MFQSNGDGTIDPDAAAVAALLEVLSDILDPSVPSMARLLIGTRFPTANPSVEMHLARGNAWVW